MPSSTISCEPQVEVNAPRVLLVDDNPAMLARVTTLLKPFCVVVGAVQDGTAALEAARQLRPDVIVLDISMPDMCGLDVAKQLRASGSTAEIVFLTVHDDDEFVQAGRAAGGLGYVIKPRLARDLAHAVAEAHAHRPFISISRATG
jgi:DNA-binding NarL/FixJ family response regulator